MINFAGMKAEERKGSYGQLPAGPYVGVIKAVKLEGVSPKQQLILRLEVTEGEYANYFYNRYKHDKENSSRYEPRYKGDLKLYIPDPDHKDEYFDSTLRTFNDALFRIEKSNQGFHFDGDENKLVGKTVGFSMQEDEYNGNVFTRLAKLETAQDVRDGLVKVMEPKKKKKGDAYDTPAASVDPQSGFYAVETDELPF